jgi:two-component system, cell cycle sensor histidine kinase and response regulator CckA
MNAPALQLPVVTVLVVDDDDGVRHVMARDLEQAGYRVLTAADGEEALTVIEQSGIQVNLVICDLLMPGLNGYELAAHLAALPNPPEIILTSGYRVDLELNRAIITKPFRAADVTAAVQRILQARSRAVSANPEDAHVS